uniref:Uncharacterized protein n=1 Tax=Knipowitschia caucasica TaxID=637954 RepID=A0AAV2LDQ6_KNICA
MPPGSDVIPMEATCLVMWNHLKDLVSNLESLKCLLFLTESDFLPHDDLSRGGEQEAFISVRLLFQSLPPSRGGQKAVRQRRAGFQEKQRKVVRPWE